MSTNAFALGLPEYGEACALDSALVRLSLYYGQSSGKRAAALVKRINTVFAPYNKGPRPKSLAPFDAAAKAQETPELAGLRAAYWRETLRPLLADEAFVKELEAVTVKRQDMYYSTEERDKNIATVKQALVYWDQHFVQH